MHARGTDDFGLGVVRVGICGDVGQLDVEVVAVEPGEAGRVAARGEESASRRGEHFGQEGTEMSELARLAAICHECTARLLRVRQCEPRPTRWPSCRLIPRKHDPGGLNAIQIQPDVLLPGVRCFLSQSPSRSHFVPFPADPSPSTLPNPCVSVPRVSRSLTRCRESRPPWPSRDRRACSPSHMARWRRSVSCLPPLPCVARSRPAHRSSSDPASQEVEALAREWVQPAPGVPFALRIPVEYLPWQAAVSLTCSSFSIAPPDCLPQRMVQTPYVWVWPHLHRPTPSLIAPPPAA